MSTVDDVTTATPPRAGASRRTRAESRAETRNRLLDAATVVFNERGIAGASVEEIAEAAGFTRGAFYSNFTDKNDLVLALVDRHNTESNNELEAMLEADPTGATVLQGLIERNSNRTEIEQTRVVLYLEFWLFAIRNPEMRDRIASVNAKVLEIVERIVRAQADALGIDLPVPAERAARMVLALDQGTGLLGLADPGGYPESFFLDVLGDLHQAMVAL
jgi:AcrR family transcriptional regulator